MVKRNLKRNKGWLNKLITVVLSAMVMVFGFSALFTSYSSPVINVGLGMIALFLLLLLADHTDKMNGYGKYDGKPEQRIPDDSRNDDMLPPQNEALIPNNDKTEKEDKPDEPQPPNQDYVDFVPDFNINQEKKDDAPKPNDSDYQQLED